MSVAGTVDEAHEEAVVLAVLFRGDEHELPRYVPAQRRHLGRAVHASVDTVLSIRLTSPALVSKAPTL